MVFKLVWDPLQLWSIASRLRPDSRSRRRHARGGARSPHDARRGSKPAEAFAFRTSRAYEAYEATSFARFSQAPHPSHP